MKKKALQRPAVRPPPLFESDDRGHEGEALRFGIYSSSRHREQLSKRQVGAAVRLIMRTRLLVLSFITYGCIQHMMKFVDAIRGVLIMMHRTAVLNLP